MFDARFHDSSSHINLTTNYVQQFMTKRWNQRDKLNEQGQFTDL